MVDISKIRTMSGGIQRTIDLTATGNVLQTATLQIVNAAVTASKPVKLDADKKITSGDIDLTAEVTGALPYANMNIADGDLTIAKTNGLQTALDGKADSVHSHAISDVTGLQTALDNKVDDSEKGAASGVATLGADGKLTASQVPSIAIVDTFVVASEAAMLALSTAETGDVAVRTDENKTYILKGTDYSTLADWQELLTPTDAVASVNGQTGTVVLDTDDIGEGAVNKYYSSTLFDSDFSGKSTTDLAEGTNLYYTQARFDSAFTAKSTSDLSEGTNLYYTQARFDSAFTAKDTDDLSEGATNKYYSSTLFDADLATKDTGDLAEGANLYYTQARFDTAFAAKDTDGLSEGSTNLYFTDARAKAAAVVNSTAGSETDQAASVSAMKDYVAAQTQPQDKVEYDDVSLLAGEAFDANKTYVVRWALNGETAGRIYKADKDEETKANHHYAVGVIQTAGGALSAGDAVGKITKIGVLNLLSGDTNVASTSDNLPLFLQNAGALTDVTPETGVTAGNEYASVICGKVKKYDATVTNTEIEVNMGGNCLVGIDIA